MSEYDEITCLMEETNLYNAIYYDDLKAVKNNFQKNREYDMIQRNCAILGLAFNRASYAVINYLIAEMDKYYNDSKSKDIVLTRLCQDRFHDHEKLHFILQHIKNINIQDEKFDKQTILHRAMVVLHASVKINKEECIKVMKILLEHGANPSIPDKYGPTAIGYIISISEYKMELFEILLNNTAKTWIDSTLLFRIVLCNYKNKYDLVEMLLPHITDMNKPLSNGNSLLYSIKQCVPNETDIIELLEANGAL